MQDLPSNSDLPEEPFYNWLCGLEDVCVQRNVELFSIPLVERNMMTILKALDDRRAVVGRTLHALSEQWRQQQQAPIPPSAPLNLSSLSIDLPPSLQKGCEVLGAMGRMVDVIIRNTTSADAHYVARAVRCMHFSAAIPLLERIAAMPVSDAMPPNSTHQHPSILYAAILLPPDLAALAETSRTASLALLETMVGARSLHYLHIGLDMIKACEVALKQLGKVGVNGAKVTPPTRFQHTDEAYKLQEGQCHWISKVLDVMASFEANDLLSSMPPTAPSSSSSSFGPPVPQLQGQHHQGGGSGAVSQVEGISPADYIAFLKGVAHSASKGLSPSLLRNNATLKRACTAFGPACEGLCRQLAEGLGLGLGVAAGGNGVGGIATTRPPALVSRSRQNSLAMRSAGNARASNVHDAAQFASSCMPSSMAQPLPAQPPSQTTAPPPQPIEAVLSEVSAARDVVRRGAAVATNNGLLSPATSFASAESFPNVEQLCAQLDTPARPQGYVTFLQQCKSVVGTHVAELAAANGGAAAGHRFDRAAMLALCGNAAAMDRCQQGLAAFPISFADARRTVEDTRRFYEQKCHALSQSLLTAQTHNAATAEVIAAHRTCNHRLQQAIQYLQGSLAAEGGGVAASFKQRMCSTEEELCVRKGLVCPSQQPVAMLAGASHSAGLPNAMEAQQQQRWQSNPTSHQQPQQFGGGGGFGSYHQGHANNGGSIPTFGNGAAQQTTGNGFGHPQQHQQQHHVGGNAMPFGSGGGGGVQSHAFNQAEGSPVFAWRS